MSYDINVRLDGLHANGRCEKDSHQRPDRTDADELGGRCANLIMAVEHVVLETATQRAQHEATQEQMGLNPGAVNYKQK